MFLPQYARNCSHVSGVTDTDIRNLTLLCGLPP